MDGLVLRLFDASLNRLREGLRVCEDYARFVLDDDRTCHDLKQIRHDISAATAELAQSAIAHRDTPSDVGTRLSTPTETRREDLTAVVAAATRRTGEALRSCEEYAKVLSPAAAAVLEQCRYRFYTVEQRLLTRAGRPPFSRVQLYVLITAAACRRPWQAVAEAAIAGGADCLQLREKDLEGAELLHRARWLVDLCRRHNVISIINDRADIAVLSGADGLHLGQGDLPVADARRIVGQRLIGVSTHNLADLQRAMTDGADYVGVGPVFPSPTKPRDILPGLDYAKVAAQSATIPAVAIAGITAANLPQVLATGLRAVAVTSAVTGADDPQAATSAFKNALATVARTPPASEARGG